MSSPRRLVVFVGVLVVGAAKVQPFWHSSLSCASPEFLWRIRLGRRLGSLHGMLGVGVRPMAIAVGPGVVLVEISLHLWLCVVCASESRPVPLFDDLPFLESTFLDVRKVSSHTHLAHSPYMLFLQDITLTTPSTPAREHDLMAHFVRSRCG